MTLIIGIKCQDGIVVGADGAATFGTLGQQTIRQETTKLDILGGNIIVGVSGPVGLAQRIKGEFLAAWQDPRNGLPNKKPYEAAGVLRQILWDKCLSVEAKVAQATQPMLGQVAFQDFISQTVVALPLQGVGTLIQFDHQGAPEEATAQLPFVSIGSGQSIADPFLSFLRRIFWPDTLPTLADGIFTTLWALEHAIQTNPGGISNPKQVIVLEKTGHYDKKGMPEWKARTLEEHEFEEHLESIRAHENNLREFHTISPENTEGAESIPQP